jgi:hypothetical protein
MWRKRKPLLPGSSAFKTEPSSTATPGSGASRRSRLARSLGLSTHDQTQNDSQSRTILGMEEEERSDPFGSQLSKETSSVVTAPRPGWARVERHASRSQSTGETGEASSDGLQTEMSNETQPKRQSWGKAPGVPKNTQGVRKNVWEVRRKS